MRLLACLVLSALIAGCGGGSSSSSSDPSNAQDTARVKLLRCLREQGIDVDDTPGHAPFARLSPADAQRAQQALTGPCSKYQTGAFGDTVDPQSDEFLDQLTKFTACMRRNGADVPDPDPAAPFTVLHTLDQSDPTIARAIEACQSKLPAMGG